MYTEDSVGLFTSDCALADLSSNRPLRVLLVTLIEALGDLSNDLSE